MKATAYSQIYYHRRLDAKLCVRCGKPVDEQFVTCLDCRLRQREVDRRNYAKRKDDPEYQRRIKEAAKRHYQKYRKKMLAYGYNRQRTLWDIWGRGYTFEGGRNIGSRWKLARVAGINGESYAVGVLAQNGFSDIIQLSYIRASPFDIAATRDGKRVGVEVTTSIVHWDKGRFQYARDLGLDFYLLFVRPRLNGYVLKLIEEPRKVYFVGAKEIRSFAIGP